MDLVEVLLLPIHHHPMTPLKDVRMGKCCGIKYEAVSDGYYCKICDYFFHKTCRNRPEMINHPSHKCGINLSLETIYYTPKAKCGLCGGRIQGMAFTEHYGCRTCSLKIHLECGKFPPSKVIDVPQSHDHTLKLEMMKSSFTCHACGKDGDGYPYKCHECDLKFHVNCGKYEVEVNHPSHSLHPLKLYSGEPPAYTDGKCRLCREKLVNYKFFYHCSACNFSLDMYCVINPPPLYHHDLNTHDHKLTLMPQMISFTCTTCGLKGDRSPYVCLQCNFITHNNCFGFPWVININRHDHRVFRTSLLGVVDAVCGVCQKKMDWSCY